MQKEPAPLCFTEPMECTPVEALPDGAEWQYELKLDGYRSIAIKDGGEVSLYSRNGHSFNAKFPAIVKALRELRPKRFVLDGEIVAVDLLKVGTPRLDAPATLRATGALGR